MKKRLYILLLATFFISTQAFAQFYTGGDDDGRLKWKQFTSENYRFIYPEGLDSLARVFATDLERYRVPLSGTSGFLANQSYKKKMPVILHRDMAELNGEVAWTPRRMEIYTVPNAFAPEAMTWDAALAVHEGRHVAQMQFSRHGKFAPLSYFTGELGSGALAAIYCGLGFYEGDAVNTETNLLFGRGKNADFLNYYKVAFDAGDLRDVYQWRYGSFNKYTPDYYRAGYLFFSGMQEIYDVPDFTKRYFDKLFEPKKLYFPFFVLSKTTRDITGKNFRQTFADISLYYRDKWAEENEARGPYMPSEQVSATPKVYTSFSDNFFAQGQLHSLTYSLVSCTTLDGRPFSARTSRLTYSPASGKTYWSEIIPDKRWNLKQTSVIHSMEPGSKSMVTLTSGSRHYNPSPSEDGKRLSVTEYPYDGGSRLLVLDAETGAEISSISAPDGFQIIESSWVDDKIYVSGLTDDGIGIYLADENFEPVLHPTQAKIKQLWSDGGCLYFTSDRTSVNELYELDPASGKTLQLTRTKFGASDFAINDGYLYYTSPTTEGNLVFRTANEDLPVSDVDFSDFYSPSERTLPQDDVELSEAEDYGKMRHLMHFHSFLPLYLDVDEIQEMSFENVFQVAGLGASAYFQNDLGTMSGSIGVGVYPQPGAFARMTYSGLYPVIDVEYRYIDKKNSISLNSYIPFNFSSGGWSRGFVPKVLASWDEAKGFRAGVAVRGYSMRPVAVDGIYPHLGIGAELGAIAGDKRIYGFLYGYLPGILPQHGIRLSTIVQKWEPTIKYSSDGKKIVVQHPTASFTADYAMPFLPLNWSGLSPAAYFRNLELTLHGEYNTLRHYKAGGSIVARLENILWIPYTTRVGVAAYDADGKFEMNLVLNIDL